jgi:hypothetical protein
MRDPARAPISPTRAVVERIVIQMSLGKVDKSGQHRMEQMTTGGDISPPVSPPHHSELTYAAPAM